jgi:hypothetical protein
VEDRIKSILQYRITPTLHSSQEEFA